MFPFIVLYFLFGFIWAMYFYAWENPSCEILDNYQALFSHIMAWPIFLMLIIICTMLLIVYEITYNKASLNQAYINLFGE